MADLWESSVVIALRDYQWLKKSNKTTFPDQYISLGGDAEAANGDAIFLDGEKLFLFEVKSLEAKVREEWADRAEPKLAFERIFKEYIHFMDDGHGYSKGLHLRQLMKCHHFVYWSAVRRGGSKVAGNLSVAPYLTKAASKLTSKNWPGDWCNERHISKIGDYFGLVEWIDEKGNPVPHSADQVLIGDMSSAGAWFSRDHERPEISELGLNPEEFVEYLGWLGGGDLPIDAVVLSSGGTFFRHVKKMSELQAIFKPPDPEHRCQERVSLDVTNTSEPRRRRFSGPWPSS